MSMPLVLVLRHEHEQWEGIRNISKSKPCFSWSSCLVRESRSMCRVSGRCWHQIQDLNSGMTETRQNRPQRLRNKDIRTSWIERTRGATWWLCMWTCSAKREIPLTRLIVASICTSFAVWNEWKFLESHEVNDRWIVLFIDSCSLPESTPTSC